MVAIPKNSVFKVIFLIPFFHSVVHAKGQKNSWTSESDDEDISLDNEGSGSGSGCGEDDTEQIICDCSSLEKYSKCRSQCSYEFCISLYGKCQEKYLEEYCPAGKTNTIAKDEDEKTDKDHAMNGYIWISIGSGIFVIGVGILALMAIWLTRKRSVKNETPKASKKKDETKIDFDVKETDYKEPVVKLNNQKGPKQNTQEKRFQVGIYGANSVIVNVHEKPFDVAQQESETEDAHPSNI